MSWISKGVRKGGAIIKDVDRQVGKGLKKAENWAEGEQEWLIPAAITAAVLIGGPPALAALGITGGAAAAGGAGAAGAAGAAGTAGVAGGTAAGTAGVAGTSAGVGTAAAGGGIMSGIGSGIGTALSSPYAGPAIGAATGAIDSKRQASAAKKTNEASAKRLRKVMTLLRNNVNKTAQAGARTKKQFDVGASALMDDARATQERAMGRLEGSGVQGRQDIIDRGIAARNAALQAQRRGGIMGGSLLNNINAGAATSIGESLARYGDEHAGVLNRTDIDTSRDISNLGSKTLGASTDLQANIANTAASQRQAMANALINVNDSPAYQPTSISDSMSKFMPQTSPTEGDGIVNLLQGLFGGSGSQSPAPVYGANASIYG